MRFSEASRQPGSQGEVVYDEAPVRARVTQLARLHGGPALDVGTGACACMAVAMARRGLQVDAVECASGVSDANIMPSLCVRAREARQGLRLRSTQEALRRFGWDSVSMILQALDCVNERREELKVLRCNRIRWGASGYWRMRELEKLPPEERAAALYGAPPFEE